MPDLPRHVAENRRYWDETADEWVVSGERNWTSTDPSWGIWGIPNGDLPLLPDDMTGRRAIELGCGTGYVSAWMRRRGASVVGIDNSNRQLETARRLTVEHGLDDIEWVHGDAEAVPRPDGSFDFAVSEYGAAIWCDPYRWIPEAHRLLRSGGQLRFLGHHPLAMVCSRPDGEAIDDRLHRGWFDLHEIDWTVDGVVDPGGIEYNMAISSWFRLVADVGFEVIDFREVRAPMDLADDDVRYQMPAWWAKRYPAEMVWMLRKR